MAHPLFPQDLLDATDRHAVIVQQLYYRFAKGHTLDPRFAHLDEAVLHLANEAWRIAQGGQLP